MVLGARFNIQVPAAESNVSYDKGWSCQGASFRRTKAVIPHSGFMAFLFIIFQTYGAPLEKEVKAAGG
jgi:hypothetical protein